jgi:hypothetical protein
METGCSMIPVFVDDPNTWTKIQVPQEIVRICKDIALLDHYNDDNTITEKLRLIDCYWYNMGYYNSAPPLFPLFK